MPRQRRFTATRGGVTVIAIGLTVLAVAVAALSIAALRQGRGPADAETTAGPAPTFTYVQRTPTASAVPTPTPTAPTDTAPGPDERFLSIGAEAMWRGTAGACGGAAPLIERSGDEGTTWQNVTPTAKGIAQLQSLTSFGGRNATAVADLGAACAKTTLRTYTDGQFWEPYPDIFAVDTYALPGERAVVVDGAKIAAPCATPWGLRSTGGVAALVCDGTAYRLDGQAWTALSGGARAVAVTSGGVYVAQTDAACTTTATATTTTTTTTAGIRVTGHPTGSSAIDLGCVEMDAAEAAGPVALDATATGSGTSLALWAGTRIIAVAN